MVLNRLYLSLPGALVFQQRMEILLLEHHLQQIQPCTCQSHCQQPKRLRLRHTSWFWSISSVSEKFRCVNQLDDRLGLNSRGQTHTFYQISSLVDIFWAWTFIWCMKNTLWISYIPTWHIVTNFRHLQLLHMRFKKERP